MDAWPSRSVSILAGQVFRLRFGRSQLLHAPAMGALHFRPFAGRIDAVEFQFHAGHGFRPRRYEFP
jgi:hypothetical protein